MLLNFPEPLKLLIFWSTLRNDGKQVSNLPFTNLWAPEGASSHLSISLLNSKARLSGMVFSAEHWVTTICFIPLLNQNILNGQMRIRHLPKGVLWVSLIPVLSPSLLLNPKVRFPELQQPSYSQKPHVCSRVPVFFKMASRTLARHFLQLPWYALYGWPGVEDLVKQLETK